MSKNKLFKVAFDGGITREMMVLPSDYTRAVDLVLDPSVQSQNVKITIAEVYSGGTNGIKNLEIYTVCEWDFGVSSFLSNRENADIIYRFIVAFC